MYLIVCLIPLSSDFGVEHNLLDTLGTINTPLMVYSILLQSLVNCYLIE